MNTSFPDQREFETMLARLVEGQASLEDRQRLNALMQQQPLARAFYLRFMSLHAQLQTKHVPCPALNLANFGFEVRTSGERPPMASPESSPAEVAPPVKNPTGRPADYSAAADGHLENRRFATSFRHLITPSTHPSASVVNSMAGRIRRGTDFMSRPMPFAMTVSTLSLATLLITLAFVRTPTWHASPSNPGPMQPVVIPTFVARMTGTHQLEWADKFASPIGQQYLALNQKLELAQGWLEITMKSGARVVVEGPATLELQSENSARLTAGKLIAEVPPRAVGFTVETPSAKVVDLGTAFGVQVSAGGATEISVSKGEVELTAIEPARGAAPSRPASTQRLVAGQALQVAATASGSVEVNSLPFGQERLMRTLPMRFRPVQQSNPRIATQLDVGTVLITPTIQAFSSEHPGNPPICPPRVAVNLVNGSGLQVGPSGILGAADTTHDNNEHHAWHQAAPNNGSETFVTFNLGTTYDLQVTRIWNLNQIDNRQMDLTVNGAKNVHISVSTNNVDYTPLTSILLKKGSAMPNEPAQDFVTLASGIQYVKLEIPTGYDPNSGEGFKGLAAVRFEGVPVSATDFTRAIK